MKWIQDYSEWFCTRLFGLSRIFQQRIDGPHAAKAAAHCTFCRWWQKIAESILSYPVKSEQEINKINKGFKTEMETNMKDMGGKSHVVTFDRWRARRDFDPKRSSGKEMISVKRSWAVAKLWKAKDATDFAGFGGCLKTQSLEIATALGSWLSYSATQTISWYFTGGKWRGRVCSAISCN